MANLVTEYGARATTETSFGASYLYSEASQGDIELGLRSAVGAVVGGDGINTRGIVLNHQQNINSQVRVESANRTDLIELGDDNAASRILQRFTNDDPDDKTFHVMAREATGSAIEWYYHLTKNQTARWHSGHVRGTGILELPHLLIGGVKVGTTSGVPSADGTYDPSDIWIDTDPTSAVGQWRILARYAIGDPWAASSSYHIGETVNPGNGFGYVVTAASRATNNGASGEAEPTWPTTIGDTVVDNELTWECWGVDTPQAIASRSIGEASERPSNAVGVDGEIRPNAGLGSEVGWKKVSGNWVPIVRVTQVPSSEIAAITKIQVG